MIGVMPCIDKRVMSLQHSASEPQFNLAATPGSTIAKSPTNTNLKASFKNFPSNPCKLDRTQSLRSNVRPLGPYNGLRDTDRTNFEVAFSCNINIFIISVFHCYHLNRRVLMTVVCRKKTVMQFLRLWSTCSAGRKCVVVIISFSFFIIIFFYT